MKRLLQTGMLATVMVAASPARAQLAITETMPSASTNLGPATVVQGPDFWELTNFGTNSMDLSGYVFNDSDAIRGGDADSTTLSGITIGPGESIILVQSGTTGVASRDDFINWWGAANLPAGLQVLFYTGNGQSSSGDSIVLWSPAAVSDADYVDRADFGEAVRGHSFTYNPTNGAYGDVSSNGVGGAFKAATSDDEGSPGLTTGPVPLVILQQPSPTNQTVPASEDATFSVVARGLPHPHFQWFFGATPIDGAVQASLTITNAQLTNAGPYRVVVGNGLQSITSSNATLAVTTAPVPPTFSTEPKGVDAFIGQTVQLTSQASGSPTPAYQWQTNGVPLPGETGAQLTIYGVQTNDAATYTVVAYNSAGTNSASAVLTVGPKPNLLITEVQSTGSSSPGGHADWWELTSFDDHPIRLQGYRWDDSSHSLAPNNAYTFTNDVTIHPGESIIFVENISDADFRAWWGTNLPPGLQIVTYAGGGLGLSSTKDEVNLWNGATIVGNELSERIAAVNFAASPLGVSFVYDPENPPVAGVFGVLATNTVDGNAANGVFTAAVSGDMGSPGYVVAPMHLSGIATNGAEFALSWNSIPGRNYAVYSADDLPATHWNLLTNVPATDANTTISAAADASRRFYRVGAVIPVVPEQP